MRGDSMDVVLWQVSYNSYQRFIPRLCLFLYLLSTSLIFAWWVWRVIDTDLCMVDSFFLKFVAAVLSDQSCLFLLLFATFPSLFLFGSLLLVCFCFATLFLFAPVLLVCFCLPLLCQFVSVYPCFTSLFLYAFFLLVCFCSPLLS